MKKSATDRPRFSIIIPTYNTTGVLYQCINAIYHQTVPRDLFEILIINDGGRNEIIGDTHFSDRSFNIRYFNQDHKGPAAARNLGIREARGDILLLLDDDSLPTRQWLDAVSKAWDAFPGYDGIGGYVASENSDSIYCRVNSDLFNWFLKQQSTNHGCNFLVTCNAGYTKSIIQKIGLFDEHYKGAYGEDRDLNIRIVNSGGKLRLDEKILVYHDRDLTFRSFVRKHFNYGKAAFNIYTRYPEQRMASAKGYMDLYTPITNQYKTLKEKIQTITLLTLSQLATAAGYFSARLFSGRN